MPLAKEYRKEAEEFSKKLESIKAEFKEGIEKIKESKLAPMVLKKLETRFQKLQEKIQDLNKELQARTQELGVKKAEAKPKDVDNIEALLQELEKNNQSLADLPLQINALLQQLEVRIKLGEAKDPMEFVSKSLDVQFKGDLKEMNKAAIGPQRFFVPRAGGEFYRAQMKQL